MTVKATQSQPFEGLSEIDGVELGRQLREVCTLGIGGTAAAYVAVSSAAAMQKVLVACRRSGIRFHILGKGSNSLFDDRGFDGLVIANKIDSLEDLGEGRFRVGAGYSFALLGVKTARQSWAGLEFSSGIPATVGGAVFMNAGANGAEVSEVLESVDYVDSYGTLRHYSREDLEFNYRRSPFQEMDGAIVAATFALRSSTEARRYQKEIVEYRIRTQPYGEPSAGCIFRNPEGGHSGQLIEAAGLKGLTVGDAKVSELHANFIVNVGHATAEDVEALIALIKQRVKDHCSVLLDEELRRIPYR